MPPFGIQLDLRQIELGGDLGQLTHPGQRGVAAGGRRELELAVPLAPGFFLIIVQSFLSTFDQGDGRFQRQSVTDGAQPHDRIRRQWGR